MGTQAAAASSINPVDMAGIPLAQARLIDVRHNGKTGGYVKGADAQGWSTFGVGPGHSKGGFQNREAIRAEASFANYGTGSSDGKTMMFNAEYKVKPGTSGVIAQIMNVKGSNFVPPMKLLVDGSGRLTVDMRGGNRHVIPGFNANQGPFELGMITDGNTFALTINGQVVFQDDINVAGGMNFFKMGLYAKGNGGEVQTRNARIMDVTDIDNLKLPESTGSLGAGGQQATLTTGSYIDSMYYANAPVLTTFDALYNLWDESELDEIEDEPEFVEEDW